jgi:hypothetical protein
VTDPDTYPTPEDDYALFEAYDEFADDGLDDDDAPEWQPGECDMCVGASGQAELAAQMASAIVPVCACLMGQGAPLGECMCGPELFAGNAGEGKPEEQPTEAGATAPTQDQG